MAEPIRTTCPYCGVGCGLLARREGEGWRIDPDPDHPANFGRICIKGATLGDTLGLENRLLFPDVGGKQAEWDEALDHIAARFAQVIAEHGPEAVGIYVSGQLLTEDYYIANKLMKGFIGSANIDSNSRLCMSSTVAGHVRAFGADMVPNAYADIEEAELIIFAGSNAAWSHPVLYQRAMAARDKRPNVKIVVIDPRRSATASAADLHLALRPGSDVALFNGLLAYLADQQKLDKDFIAQHVEGFDEALAAARTDSPEICDLPPADLETFYRWFAATAKTLTFYSQGINQSSAGTDKVNALLNCHLATGRVGKPGSGPLSLTGQPNAMGGREAGSLANALAAHMFFDDASIDRVGRFWAAAKMAAKPGLKTIDLFQAVEEGKIKALWIAATNPAVSLPDSHRVRKALAKCPFVVIADCENKTDAMPFAHVRLPALAWGEKDGMVTNSDRAISRQRGFMNPPGEARPDWWMWAELGKRLGHEQAFSYAEPSEIFQEFARLTAFENDGSRDLDLGGLIGRDYRAHSPIQWPVRKDGQGTARLSRFFTPNGKARCLPISFRPPVNLPSPEFPFILNTGRSRDHWHTQTRTGRSSRLAGHTPEPALFIHPEDAKRAELLEGGLAVVESPLGAIHVRVQCDPGQRLGELFIPIHWNDQVASNGVVSRLIATATDPISGQPESKHTPVRIRPLASLWTALILSRAEVSFGDGVFWSRSNGRNHHVYRLEGLTPIDDWHVQARAWLGEDREWVEMMDGRRSIFRAAALDDRRLGAILYVAPDAHNLATPWLAEAFDKPLLNIQERMAVLAGGPGGRPRGDRLICSCFAVPQSTILATIEKHKLTSAAEIGNLLKAGTNCGSCLPEINALLAKKNGTG